MRISAIFTLALALTVGVFAATAGGHTGRAAAKCAYRRDGALPDSSCTPGATNPKVRQSDIDSTICKSGWTATIRPPESVTEPQKYKSMAQYGDTDSASNYEYDHLISLELGGAPDSSKNLWPEPHKTSNNLGSYVKDTVENSLKRQVCDGEITLKQAQHTIRTDWTKAL